MKLTRFDGGINLATAAHLIAPNESVECVDIDFDKSVLKALPGVTLDSAIPASTTVSSHYWLSGPGTHTTNFQSLACEAEWVEYQEKLFWTSACDIPRVNIAGTVYPLGLEEPDFELEFVVKQQQLSPRDMAVAAGVVPATPTDSAELRYYVPGVGLSAGTFPAKPVNPGYDLAYVNITDPDLPDSKPTYMTRAIPNTDVGTHGIDHEPEVEADVTTPSVPVSVPRMELKVYRKYNGRYIYIATMFNWYPTVAPIIEDNDPEGSEDPPIYLENKSALDGDFTYGYAMYDSVTGAESTIRLLPEFDLNNEVVWFDRNSIPVGKTIRVYRIGGELTLYTLIGTASSGEPGEYLVDNFSDAELAGNSTYDSGQVGVPPEGLRYLTELNAMFFGAFGDKLRFTPVGNPYAWPAEFYLDFPAPITGIGKSSVGLLVFSLFETWLVTGNNPATLAVIRICGSQGCIKHHSIAYTRNSCLWFSAEGLCTSSGTNVILQSRPRLGKLALKPTDVKNAVLLDEKYYLLMSNSRVFIADFVHSAFGYASSSSGALLWLMIAPTTASNSVLSVWGLMTVGSTKRRGTLFTNTTANLRSWEYITGFFIGAGLTQQKTYKDIWVYAKPPVQIIVKSKGVIIASKTLDAELEEDIYQVQVQSDKIRGKYIQLEMRGTGEIHEIQFDEASANA